MERKIKKTQQPNGEGNGTPLQYSCLKNLKDGGAWLAAVHVSARAGHDWTTSLSLFTFMHWRGKWQPTPVLLPGESQGQRSLVGCRLWGRTESDTTEQLSSSSSSSNNNPIEGEKEKRKRKGRVRRKVQNKAIVISLNIWVIIVSIICRIHYSRVNKIVRKHIPTEHKSRES